MAVGIKYLFSTFKYPKYIFFRNIKTTSWKSEKAMENLQNNPYYEKYADKIAEMLKTSPEEFLKRVEEQGKNKNTEKKKKFASVDTRQYSSVLNPKHTLNEEHREITEDKKLNDIFKLELVADKDAKEVQIIWEEYHKHKEVISATIPKEIYETIQFNMKQFPTFVFPLPRSQGYEFIMSQISGHNVHFTPLLAFQVHKENAPECLTMVHYTELVTKGIVLMRGEYDKNVLNGKEAQCLANQFQLYYCGRNENKIKLLELFNKTPDVFKHMDLISELENIEVV